MNENHHFDPLVERYASSEMVEIFSPENRYQSWRKLWLALARAEKDLGLPITDEQILALENAQTAAIDFLRVKELEDELNHDVMAHLHAFAETCEVAKPIIHLGATSAFITDNADMMLIREGLTLVANRLQALGNSLKDFCKKNKATRCVGFTHFQVAMPTTLGRRAAFWLQDLAIDGQEICHRIENLRTRGVKGTTGTQASFLKLFDGDESKVKSLDEKVCALLGFNAPYSVTGQVYPRKTDSHLLATLTGISESLAKMATDVRLMQHMREIEEPFSAKQVGSSAMPFKRNPILSERICSLSRILIGYYTTAAATSSNQWLERSLDDSAVRRLSIPRSFLLTDALLVLAKKLVDGLQVHETTIAKHLDEQKPFLLTEMLLMEGVKMGEDRQSLHEIIRKHSMEAFHRVYDEGKDNDLLTRLKSESVFAPLLKRMQDEEWEKRFLVGRAQSQIDEVIENEWQPFLTRLDNT